LSLRAFHLFFITVSGLLSLFLVVWGLYDFKTTGAGMGLGLSLLGTVGVVLLSVYFRWFRQKYPKLTPMLLATLILGLSVAEPRLAAACSTCYLDPNNPLTKGAIMGVVVLAAIIVGVLIGIAYIGYSWHRRAKLMSTHL